MLAASIGFSLMSVLLKALAPRIPTAELVLFRCALPLPFLVWWLRRRGIPLVARNRPLMLGRAVAGTIAMSLSFYAIARLPLADVTLIGKVEPVLIALLAPALLGERPAGRTIGCLMASIAGAALVLQPSLRIGNLAGLAALVASLAGALAHLSVRRMSADDDPAVIVLGFTVFTAVFAAIAAAPTAVLPTPGEALGLVAMAALATVAQLLMTHAYVIEEASVVSGVSYVTVPLAVLWGWMLWNERPGPLAAVGGVLVVGAGIALLRSRRFTGQRRYAPRVA